MNLKQVMNGIGGVDGSMGQCGHVITDKAGTKQWAQGDGGRDRGTGKGAYHVPEGAPQRGPVDEMRDGMRVSD